MEAMAAHRVSLNAIRPPPQGSVAWPERSPAFGLDVGDGGTSTEPAQPRAIPDPHGRPGRSLRRGLSLTLGDPADGVNNMEPWVKHR